MQMEKSIERCVNVTDKKEEFTYLIYEKLSD